MKYRVLVLVGLLGVCRQAAAVGYSSSLYGLTHNLAVNGHDQEETHPSSGNYRAPEFLLLKDDDRGASTLLRASMGIHEQTPPDFHVDLQAYAPGLPDDNPQKWSGFYSKVVVQFSDYLRIDWSESSALAAAVGFKAHLDAKMNVDYNGYNPFEAFGRGESHLDYFLQWGSVSTKGIVDRQGRYDSDGNPIFGSFDPTNPWSAEMHSDFKLPGLRIINDIPISLTLTTWVAAENNYGGPVTASMNAWDTFAIDGLIAYDADGNVLPAGSLAVTSDSGFVYPVLGPEAVPEPSGLALLGGVAAAALGGRWRRRGNHLTPPKKIQRLQRL